MENDGLDKVKSWEKNGYHFTCTVAYWSGSPYDNAAAYFFYGTDWKFGGRSRPGYYLGIEFNEYDEELANRIHGWVRLVRPFKGPYGSGKIEEFWETGKTGDERKILVDVEGTINSGLDGNLRTPTEILAEKYKIALEAAKKSEKEVERAKAKAKKVKMDAEMLRKKWHEISQQEKVDVVKAADAETAAVKAEAVAVKAEKDAATAEKEATAAEALAIEDSKIVENISKISKEEDKSDSSEEEVREVRECGGCVDTSSSPTVSKYVKLAIPTVCVAMIIGLLALGNGVNPFDDITESVPSVIGPCEVDKSILVTSGTTQGKIYLKECKEVLTVSGNFNESAQVNLTLVSPDMKKTDLGTSVKKEFSTTIDKELYDKQAGIWSIRITVNGDPQGILEFMQN